MTKLCNADQCNKKHYSMGLCYKHYRIEYAKEHKDAMTENRKRYRINHPEKHTHWAKKRTDGWKPIVETQIQCQICGKEITYNSGDIRTSISFDHRHDGKEPIKGSPAAWLPMHSPSEKNIAIWKECDFGILCSACNRILPTKNREEYLLKQIRYILGDKAKIAYQY